MYFNVIHCLQSPHMVFSDVLCLPSADSPYFLGFFIRTLDETQQKLDVVSWRAQGLVL